MVVSDAGTPDLSKLHRSIDYNEGKVYNEVHSPSHIAWRTEKPSDCHVGNQLGACAGQSTCCAEISDSTKCDRPAYPPTRLRNRSEGRQLKRSHVKTTVTAEHFSVLIEEALDPGQFLVCDDLVSQISISPLAQSNTTTLSWKICVTLSTRRRCAMMMCQSHVFSVEENWAVEAQGRSQTSITAFDSGSRKHRESCSPPRHASIGAHCVTLQRSERNSASWYGLRPSASFEPSGRGEVREFWVLYRFPRQGSPS